MTNGDGGRIAGYRIVRKLGAGSRADAYLAAGETGVAVLKVFHPGVPHADVGRELEALSRLDSPHFVHLLDVSSGGGAAPVLVLERVQRGSVAGLLRDRDALERGEVVTLVAPIADALGSLHRRGVAHGRIGAASLHIGASGEPVLLGFGHAELFAANGSIASMDTEPAAENDRHGLASLCVALLSHVRDAAIDPPTVELIGWLDAAPREFEFAERLALRLFEYAEPAPIEFGRPARQLDGSVPARLDLGEPYAIRPGPFVSGNVDESPAQRVGVQAHESVGEGIIGWLQAALAENPLDALKTRVRVFAGGVRKPIWFVAGGVAIALVLAAVLLPQGPPSAPAASATTATTRARDTSITDPSGPVRTIPTPAALPDDPVAALPILLTERSRCIRALSVLCLDDIDEASSSAYNDDAELVEELQGGSEIPKSAFIVAAAPTLTELLGDSAILRLGAAGGHTQSNPASVLMVRDEAGWRIRGYLSDVPSTGTPGQGEQEAGG